MKIAYIAHPISGEIAANISRVLNIVEQINLTEPDTVPFAPYIPDCLALNDDIPEHRNRGISNDIALFKRGFIDEVRLYGDRISNGMLAEIQLARELNIPVIPCTKATKQLFEKL